MENKTYRYQAIITLRCLNDSIEIERVLFNTLILDFNISKPILKQGLNSYSNSPLALAYNQEVNKEVAE